ncbi:hypothetical protein HY488_03540 [Candidatus Woesearchaeota archaeon]|nr:hypothetical protein [Candidatus Woesearchaeota archaeon]
MSKEEKSLKKESISRAEIEKRLHHYTQFKTKLLSALASLNDQLRKGQLSEKDYAASVEKLCGGTSQQKIDYYDSIINGCKEELHASGKQHGRKPIFSVTSLTVVIAIILFALVIAIPNWNSIKGFVVYHPQYVDVAVNTFVPEDAVILLSADQQELTMNLSELNLTLITSVYQHTLIQGYYIEEVTLDIANLSFANAAEFTLRILHNGSLLFNTTVPILSPVPTPSPAGQQPPQSESDQQQDVGINTPLDTNTTSALSPIPTTSTISFIAKLNKEAYAINETVFILITPENASYSITLTDSVEAVATIDTLNLTPQLQGQYSLNVLLYIGDQSQRFVLPFTVGDVTNISTNITSNITSNATSATAQPISATPQMLSTSGDVRVPPFERIRADRASAPQGWYMQQSGLTDTDEACVDENSWELTDESYRGSKAMVYRPTRDTLVCGLKLASFSTVAANQYLVEFYFKTNFTNPISTLSFLNYGDDNCEVVFNGNQIVESNECTATLTDAQNGWKRISIVWPINEHQPADLYFSPPTLLRANGENGAIIIDEVSISKIR